MASAFPAGSAPRYVPFLSLSIRSDARHLTYQLLLRQDLTWSCVASRAFGAQPPSAGSAASSQVRDLYRSITCALGLRSGRSAADRRPEEAALNERVPGTRFSARAQSLAPHRAGGPGSGGPSQAPAGARVQAAFNQSMGTTYAWDGRRAVMRTGGGRAHIAPLGARLARREEF